MKRWSRSKGTLSVIIVIGLLCLITESCRAFVTFRDSHGTSSATCGGHWRYTLIPGNNPWVWIRIPDPTWGWTKSTDDLSVCNYQSINFISIDCDVAPDSIWIDSEHGYRWYLFIFGQNPTDVVIDVQVNASASLSTVGLDMHDYRDPDNAWCDWTQNIDPAYYYQMATQMEAGLDSGSSLCGNEGVIQAFTAYAGSQYSNCRDAAICLAGMLRSRGIPTSIDVTYQVASTAQIAGMTVNIYGGMHAQCSAWNWTTGKWERCDPGYAANFVHPADILIGRVADPDYLTPGSSVPGGYGAPSFSVDYISGSYGDDIYVDYYQTRLETSILPYKIIATCCFASYGCGSHMNSPYSPPPLEIMTGVEEAELKQIPFFIKPLMNPCIERVIFSTVGESQVDIYAVSGRHITTMHGVGELSTYLSPGVYLYRVQDGFSHGKGKLVVVR